MKPAAAAAVLLAAMAINEAALRGGANAKGLQIGCATLQHATFIVCRTATHEPLLLALAARIVVVVISFSLSFVLLLLPATTTASRCGTTPLRQPFAVNGRACVSAWLLGVSSAGDAEA